VAAQYNGQQISLHTQALRYIDLGYSVGMAKGKEYLGHFDQDESRLPPECDGISFVPDGIVCIDYDCDFKDLGWRRDVPPTLKEKTPRGWHLFYQLPKNPRDYWKPVIEWQKDIDLLVNDGRERPYKNKSIHWARHILVSPTPGYKRIYPDQVPQKDKLTIAPEWLIKEITSGKPEKKKSKYEVDDSLIDFFIDD